MRMPLHTVSPKANFLSGAWTILKWEILLLDFFEVGDSDAGLSS